MEAYIGSRHIRYGRRKRYTINKRRFTMFLTTLFLLIVLILYIIMPDVFSNQYRVGDMEAEHLNIYFNTALDQKVPWFYLAAVDKAEKISAGNVTTERSGKIGLYLQDIQSSDQLRDMLANYREDKKFLSKVDREVKKFKYLNGIYEGKVFPILLGYEYVYEDGFGAKRTYGGERSHEGIDIMCDFDTPVISVCNGTVKKKGWLELGGWRLYIEGSDGIDYYYAHLSKYAASIKEGSNVKKGQLIGYVGDTGYGSIGTSGKFEPHLHFGMYEKGKAVNPYPFLKAWELYKEEIE